MVFARTKLLIQDNCFEEDPGSLELNYVGPQPQKLYSKAYDLIKVVFKVADSDIQEDQYSWGKGKKEKFKVRWWVTKEVDRFTYFYIRVRLSGEGDEKTGNATLEIRPLLRTEYPQDTLWQKSLFYEMMRTFWHRVSYHRKRVEFGEECRHLTTMYAHKFQEFFRELKEKYG
jgi:hypothetical protein